MSRSACRLIIQRFCICAFIHGEIKVRTGKFENLMGCPLDLCFFGTGKSTLHAALQPLDGKADWNAFSPHPPLDTGGHALCTSVLEFSCTTVDG